MKKRITLTKRSIEAINKEYSELCLKLGDALVRKEMAEREAEELWPRFYALNHEARTVQGTAAPAAPEEKK